MAVCAHRRRSDGHCEEMSCRRYLSNCRRHWLGGPGERCSVEVRPGDSVRLETDVVCLAYGDRKARVVRTGTVGVVETSAGSIVRVSVRDAADGGEDFLLVAADVVEPVR